MSNETPARDSLSRPEVPLLEARDVRKTYTMGKRSLEVLKGVNLIVERGAFLALQGASGAGKSTLLHLLGGIDHVTAGEVHLGGQQLSSFSPSDRARVRSRKVGFIFQAYHLLSELNATENVCLPARLARMPSQEAEERARELLRRVGLGERLEHRPYELSGGEQQRVAIARALINSPELVLADEPTGNLDSQTGSEIIELLCALRDEKQMTLIVATHDMQVAGQAPRVVRLRDGRVANEAREP